MRIRSLAQGKNILMLRFEPANFVSKIDILTTTPIVDLSMEDACQLSIILDCWHLHDCYYVEVNIPTSLAGILPELKHLSLSLTPLLQKAFVYQHFKCFLSKYVHLGFKVFIHYPAKLLVCCWLANYLVDKIYFGTCFGLHFFMHKLFGLIQLCLIDS